MVGNSFHITKGALVEFLKSIDADSVKFDYVRNGNDGFNPCGTPKKQATYEES